MAEINNENALNDIMSNKYDESESSKKFFRDRRVNKPAESQSNRISKNIYNEFNNEQDWKPNDNSFNQNMDKIISHFKVLKINQMNSVNSNNVDTVEIDIVSIANIVAYIFKWECRYVVDAKKWYRYNKGYWKADDYNIIIFKYIKAISDKFLNLYNGEYAVHKLSGQDMGKTSFGKYNTIDKYELAA